MKAILTLVAVAFTAMVSNIVQAEGAGQPPPPSTQVPGAQSPEKAGGQGGTSPSGQKSGAQGASQGKAGASASGMEQGGATAPDNTGRNKERGQGKPEAQDQSNESGDLELTARLRRAITDDDSLSVNAHNIKIITQGGKVTLRGPVDSQAEKSKVEALARKAAGGRQVANELEVKPGGSQNPQQQQKKP